MKFDINKLAEARHPDVTHHIHHWEMALKEKYLEGNRQAYERYLAADYQWFGTVGEQYALSDNAGTQRMYQLSEDFRAGFSDIVLSHHMLGESNMAGNYCIVEATHSGTYCGIEATGNRVRFATVAIARFDPEGNLVEERELWDELGLLRQIDFIRDKTSTLLVGLISAMDKVADLSLYPSINLPEISRILYCDQTFEQDNRDLKVLRNIASWLKFTEKKYTRQDFETINEVMSSQYQYFGSGNYHADTSIPAVRQDMLNCFKAEMEEHPDIHFHSHLFGEGDMAVYNVAPEFTHTDNLLGIPPTHRRLRFVNISIGRFDAQGRIAEETEIHDFIAMYKQLGLIPNDKPLFRLVDVLRHLEERIERLEIPAELSQ